MALTLRELSYDEKIGKNSKLTYAELDENFRHLDRRITNDTNVVYSHEHTTLSSLQTALEEKSILVVDSPILVNEDWEITSDIIIADGLFVINDCSRLTIFSPNFECGVAQCFYINDMMGDVQFGLPFDTEILPEWFGVIHDDIDSAVTNTTNINKMFSSNVAGDMTLKIKFGSHEYYVSGQLEVVNDHIEIYGQDSYFSCIIQVDIESYILYDNSSPSPFSDVYIHDIVLAYDLYEEPDENNDVDAIHIVGSNVRLDNVSLYSCINGFRFLENISVVINNCSLYAIYKTGAIIESGSVIINNSNVFYVTNAFNITAKLCNITSCAIYDYLQSGFVLNSSYSYNIYSLKTCHVEGNGNGSVYLTGLLDSVDGSTLTIDGCYFGNTLIFEGYHDVTMISSNIDVDDDEDFAIYNTPNTKLSIINCEYNAPFDNHSNTYIQSDGKISLGDSPSDALVTLNHESEETPVVDILSINGFTHSINQESNQYAICTPFNEVPGNPVLVIDHNATYSSLRFTDNGMEVGAIFLRSYESPYDLFRLRVNANGVLEVSPL